MVRAVSVDGDRAHVGIVLTIVGCPAAARIEEDVRRAAASVPGIDDVDVTVGVMTPDERRALTEKLRDGRPARQMPFGPDSLTRVILVSSGKGGVGKSTVTANLAVALAEQGLSVGLVDADVHGFSIPGLLGIPAGTQPTRIDDLMLPPVAHGVKTISIGMFLRDGEAVVAWRGPMLHRTVQQFLTDVFFGDLDVLLIDMPPGTGDIAISIGQLLPHAEVLVVTTPADRSRGRRHPQRSGGTSDRTARDRRDREHGGLHAARRHGRRPVRVRRRRRRRRGALRGSSGAADGLHPAQPRTARRGRRRGAGGSRRAGGCRGIRHHRTRPFARRTGQRSRRTFSADDAALTELSPQRPGAAPAPRHE
ncbi:hypothetical protein HA402_007015 [Bradysia odoriphaga]|nr:hypothetical protein HA402_007015 [Bradysia odoriphaga]